MDYKENTKKDSYGSPKIRDRLNSNTLLSLGIAALLLVSAFGGAYLVRQTHESGEQDDQEEKLIAHAELSKPPQLEEPKPEPPQPEPPEPEPKEPPPEKKPAPEPAPKKVPPKPDPQKEVEFTEPEIEEDPEFVDDDIPSQKMLQESGTQVKPPGNTTETGEVSPSEEEGTPASATKEDSESDERVFEVVETDPQFPGGTKALKQYLSNNIEYPMRARRQATQGDVIVQFIVKKDGSISDINVVKGLGDGLNQEAIRLVKSMPKWNPGKQRGRPVEVKYTLPITFNLGS